MNKRIILAFALSIAVFALYSVFVLPRFSPAPVTNEPGAAVPPQPAGAPAEAAPAAAEAQAQASPAPQAAPAAPAAAAQAGVPEKYRQDKVSAEDVTVATDVMTVIFTPRSAAIKSVVLSNYKNFNQSGPLVFLKDFTTGDYPLATPRFGDDKTGDLLWALEAAPVAGRDREQSVTFATVLPSGLKIAKTFTLYPGKYGIGVKVALQNLTAAPKSLTYDLVGPAGVPSEDMNRNDVVGVLAMVPAAEGIKGKMELKETAAAALLPLLGAGDVSVPAGMRANFAGAYNRYFAAVVRPDPDVPLAGTSVFAVADSKAAKDTIGDRDPVQLAESLPPKERGGLANVFYTAGSRFSVGTIDLAAAGAPGAEAAQSFLLFCGPKTPDAISAFDTTTPTGFTVLLNYGWFEPIVKLILLLMKLFHAVIPNWGVAIILLTLLVRLLMHPLTRKSQVSMAKMAKIQPHIKKLQEKYKGDKKKLGEEQMKLMKEHGANPLGGCLPMLIQLPIFFALYRALMVSIDLRHASFFVIPGHWIKDLAQPDVLWTFATPIPFPLMGPIEHFNLLPILMAVAMALQQIWAVKPATPEQAQQQKIMGILMPIFMGGILYKFASGLNLYIFTSTVSGIIEQWIIKRHLAAQDAAAAKQ